VEKLYNKERRRQQSRKTGKFGVDFFFGWCMVLSKEKKD
jgi:hypothetical protein